MPCPVDPTHTIPPGAAARLRHLSRCTAALRAARVAARPWYRRGINSGGRAGEGSDSLGSSGRGGSSDDSAREGEAGEAGGGGDGGDSGGDGNGREGADGQGQEAPVLFDARAARERARPLRAAVGAHAGRAQRRARRVGALGRDGFAALVGRLEAAHAGLVEEGGHPPVRAEGAWEAAFCGSAAAVGARRGGKGEEEEEDEGAAAATTAALRARARAWDPALPVDGRHARQHAAVAAVLRARGLLPAAGEAAGEAGAAAAGAGAAGAGAGARAGAGAWALVELGAGKGYLSAWLVLECCLAARAAAQGEGAAAAPYVPREDGAGERRAGGQGEGGGGPAPAAPFAPSAPSAAPFPAPPPAPFPAPFRAIFLVDAAANLGRKADRRLRAAPRLERVTADLRDVDLARLLLCCPEDAPAGQEGAGGAGAGAGAGGPFVAVGKHLCGVATDFSLRAFARAVAAGPAGAAAPAPPPGCSSSASPSPSPSPRRVVAVATCCHHRGRWRDFCGRAAWRAAGLSRGDFEAALWLCGWANGPSASGAAAAAAAAAAGAGETPRAWHRRLVVATGAAAGSEGDEAAAAAVLLGRRCRELLDAARCAWLERRLRRAGGGGAGTRVEHLAFVAPSVTPENRLILGVVGG